MNGRHGADGGYIMQEPLPHEHEQLLMRMELARDLLEEWAEAGERLVKAYTRAAAYGPNLAVFHGIQDAERAYDAAKAVAQAWMNPAAS